MSCNQCWLTFFFSLCYKIIICSITALSTEKSNGSTSELQKMMVKPLCNWLRMSAISAGVHVHDSFE